MKRKKQGHLYRQNRARTFKDERIDTYREKQKYKELTRCADCGALFVDGRWTWNETHEATTEALCPACKRIEDNYPAGFVELSGTFFGEHREEILQMVRNLERAESDEHPLERVMKIDNHNGTTLITTTGHHMARRLGEALKSAYQGNLEISYDAENFVRIYWQR